ncbi:MAG: UDP-glucose 4-epimerase GalE [Melioribacteraceae bacterium]|nr:UDP-glucose 4-epimerase GalE [Melioribacteraceae bacterium]MCF8265703.1 UDP-glucose 4-epimerase GalE [Melioribacteraceae bacterium]MCF8413546.1 UDP-glucose 4-epimerase GalE [Melioribacteraceae bacterium]MCF8431380.1 UDP-glucose 4-epimerase GalE [Melioribacteraceae bacterium]
MKKLNILVTGGAGYIGSHICHDLIELGHNVIILDNLSTGLEENLHPDSVFIQGDVRSKFDLSKAFDKKVDVVFHFAAWKAAGESMFEPFKYFENNIFGTMNLLEEMILNNCKNFVFSSSAAVYGSPEYLPIDEKHPKKPLNYYGYTKLAIEDNLEWMSSLKGINYAALRYFNATGYDVKGRVTGKEKNPANLSPIVMEVAVGVREGMQVFGDDYDTKDGTCFRDYIHVNDLASAHILAMNYLLEKKSNLGVNLGTGTGWTVLDVIKEVEKVTGRNVKFDVVGRREGDPAGLIASANLAYEKLGWSAKHSDLNTIFSSMKGVYLP